MIERPKGRTVRYSTFPRTEAPPSHINEIVDVFHQHKITIGTLELEKGLTSDAVLKEIRPALEGIGFIVEGGKTADQKIKRPVFFGENGIPKLQYEIDAYHAEWNCGLEVEAGRAWMGNAVYRDLIQALVMVELQFLVIAVPNAYKFQTGGRTVINPDYEKAVEVADALYAHSRLRMPYRLTLIGY
jgi:hypothetical protein